MVLSRDCINVLFYHRKKVFSKYRILYFCIKLEVFFEDNIKFVDANKQCTSHRSRCLLSFVWSLWTRLKTADILLQKCSWIGKVLIFLYKYLFVFPQLDCIVRGHKKICIFYDRELFILGTKMHNALYLYQYYISFFLYKAKSYLSIVQDSFSSLVFVLLGKFDFL